MFRLKFALVFCLLASIPALAGDIPGWMQQAAASAVPTYGRDISAVVLLDEQQVTLGKDGKLVTIENFAVKLLSNDGRQHAVAKAFYLVSSGKVREIEAWLIRPDGSTKTYDKKSILDIISDTDDVYNEGRIKIIDASREVEAGSIFGYTVISEDIPLFYQDTWSFQGSLPTLVSRYALNLPAGWKASSITFNAPEVKPSITGNAYSWEMRNMAPIPSEPMSPAVFNLAPRIALNYAPDAGEMGVNRAFASWAEVSQWASTLSEPQVIVDDAVAAKARDLTVNSKTDLERIYAIAAFVQNLQYISIDIGVGHGNGYRPRPSNLVLSRGYGDCKDKANLMRALLRALRIEAYPIVIFAGDPTFVRAQWPSPRQFNHCIIAVRVKDDIILPTVMKSEGLGRLLIFDATDPHTRIGDLPSHLQGSLALVVAGDKGELLRMPVTPPETDMLDRRIEVTLSGSGEITGTIKERASGQASTAFRREFRASSASDYRQAIEGWLASGATGARLDKLLSKDGLDNTDFELEMTFTADRYGQLLQNRLLIFKPVIIARRNSIYLTETKRVNPVEIDSSAMKETAVFNLPAGFVVDEMPDAANLETPFGSYATKYEIKGTALHFTRHLTMNRMLLGAEKYASARDFFSKIRDAEQSPVVLIKK